MNKFSVQKPTFSVKIINQPTVPDGISIGVAVDSSRYTQALFLSSWCYLNSGYNYAIGSNTISPYKTKVNDTVTVSVNATQKTIEYKVNGNSTRPPILMSISDSQFQLLRPIVQIKWVGLSVEIYP